MAKTVGGWKVGVCYRWMGSMWMNLEPEYNYTEQYQAALYHICEIEELMKNTGHFGALFAKMLVAQQAFIDNLVARRFRIDSDPNSDTDFEAWFDETNGLLIKNNNEDVFKVTPNGFAFMKNAKFEGEIDCQGFQVLNSPPAPQQFLYSWSAGDNALTVFQKITTLKDKNFLGDNSYYYDTPLASGHAVDGTYGTTTIRYIKCEQWCSLGITNVRVTLYNNNGEIIEKICGGKRSDDGVYLTWYEDDSAGISKWVSSQQNATVNTYNPSQIVEIPNITFSKPSKKNILYRDENGFVKIS